MEMPEDKETVRSFLGMVSFLNKYSAHVVTLYAPLSACTHQHKGYIVTGDHCECFTKLKKEISNMKALPHFNVNEETILQMDASKKGLGAALM